MTDAQPPDALQSKLLGIIREFKGLNGISTARLAREAKKEMDLVQRTLIGLESDGMVRPRTADNLLLWMITIKGERVLNGQPPGEEDGQGFPLETPVPSETSAPEPEGANEAEEDIDIPVDMPTAPLPDEPTTWYVCDHVDEQGNKCAKRFASPMGLTVHKAMMHTVKDATAPERPIRGPRGDFPCDVEGCTFVASNAQGLQHHKTSKHKEIERPASTETFPCTEKGCKKVFDTAQGLLMHRQRVHLKTFISPGRPKVTADASIDKRIKQLYPDHTTKEMCIELGLNRKAVAKRITILIKKGELQYKQRPSVLRVSHSSYYEEIKRLREKGLKRSDIAKELGLTQNVVAACIQELIDKGMIESITHPHGEWHVPEEVLRQRDQALIEGRAAGKSNGQVADELGLDLSSIEKIASRLIQEGTIPRRAPVPSAWRGPTPEEAASPDVGWGKPASPPAVPDPFAGLAKMLAELNAIPGVRVSISISLGVNS